MTARTRVGYAFPDDLDVVKNWRLAVANDPRCIGIWKFDPNSVVIENGVVARAINWKAGGPDLVLTNPLTARPAVAFDPVLGRQVAVFSKAAASRLTLSGYAPALVAGELPAHSIGAVVNPDVIDIQPTEVDGDPVDPQQNIAGFWGATTNRMGLSFSVTNAPAAAVRMYQGSLIAQNNIAQNRWQRLVGVGRSLAGGSLVSLDGNSPVGSTGAQTGLANTPTFSVGHASATLGARVDQIALFVGDLYASGFEGLRRDYERMCQLRGV